MKPRTPRRRPDTEIVALSKCLGTLGACTPAERARIVTYLASRYIEGVQAEVETIVAMELAQHAPASPPPTNGSTAITETGAP